jgi:hypothetical protein
MSIELTSGEALYKANDIGSIGKTLCTDVAEEFWMFLDTTRSFTGGSEEALYNVKAIGSTVESYILKLRHRILTVRKSVEHMKVKVLNEVNYENNRLLTQILEQQKAFDCEALELVLQYYAVIQQEIADSRRKLFMEMQEKGLQIKQAKLLRDIRLFASHLMIESRGKMCFTMLPSDSQQFARCVKAVMDNINVDRLEVVDAAEFQRKVRVLNVFKLQNSFLSSKLQVTIHCCHNHVSMFQMFVFMVQLFCCVRLHLKG